jgi:hypothetical protein
MKKSAIDPPIAGNRNQVLMRAVVELVSRVQRPFMFRVTVVGQPPHAVKRVYELPALDDKDAAQTCMKRFEREMLHPSSILLAV